MSQIVKNKHAHSLVTPAGVAAFSVRETSNVDVAANKAGDAITFSLVDKSVPGFVHVETTADGFMGDDAFTVEAEA